MTIYLKQFLFLFPVLFISKLLIDAKKNVLFLYIYYQSIIKN